MSGNYFTQQGKLFEKGTIKSGAQLSRIATQRQGKENYHI
jgi:hypothetical protein